MANPEQINTVAQTENISFASNLATSIKERGEAFDANVPAQQALTRHYGFEIGGLKLLLPSGLYSELISKAKATPLPNSPGHMIGLMNLRGNLISLYKIHHLLGYKPPKSGNALLIGTPLSGAAIIVDGKPQALNIPKDQKPESSPSSLPSFMAEFVDSSYLINDEIWHTFDETALLTRLTQATIKFAAP
ncbi:MAG: hypothetical protein COA42_03470 [Alteromonadaceae bacterium]|nr:MAG: hypothetical protein COA42_03470 [Alteromonadaceae bacterium]